MRTFLLIITFIICKASIGQNYIYKGDKQYISTQTWWFTLNKITLWASQLGVCIAKVENGGLLMLSVGTLKGETISNEVSIILENGQLLILKNKVATDYLDEKSQALYQINYEQFNKLKISKISKIRFFVKGSSLGMGGSHSANNIRIGTVVGTYEKGWDTEKEISEIQ